MKKLFLIFGIASVFFLAAQPVKAQDTQSEQSISAENVQPIEVGNKVCPVSGMEIDSKTKATYEYEGKIYNFCCPMCFEEFKKDPQKYITKLGEEQKAQPKAQDSQTPADPSVPMGGSGCHGK